MARRKTKSRTKPKAKSKTKSKTSRRKRQSSQGARQRGDVNSKIVFENKELFAQFLRDYSGIPYFSNIQPEDLELVPLRYHPFDGVEFQSDNVMRVRADVPEYGCIPFYFVFLADHKTSVDHRAVMQLLVYMVSIWLSWEKEALSLDPPLDPKRVDFRYPMVIPIVYYEGTGRWTASLHLKDRIFMAEQFPQLVPDFEHLLVNLHAMDPVDIKENQDEMSLIMLLNRIQSADDFPEILKLLKEMEPVLANSKESVLVVISQILESLCRKINLPAEDRQMLISLLRKEDSMGYFFENIEKMDIQMERRLRTEAQEDLRIARVKAQEDLRVAKEQAQERLTVEKEDKYRSWISLIREFVSDREVVRKKLQEQFAMSDTEADQKLREYWSSDETA